MPSIPLWATRRRGERGEGPPAGPMVADATDGATGGPRQHSPLPSAASSGRCGPLGKPASSASTAVTVREPLRGTARGSRTTSTKPAPRTSRGRCAACSCTIRGRSRRRASRRPAGSASGSGRRPATGNARQRSARQRHRGRPAPGHRGRPGQPYGRGPAGEPDREERPGRRRVDAGRHGAWFAERVIAVKLEYELSVDPRERDALEALLAGGGAQLSCVDADTTSVASTVAPSASPPPRRRGGGAAPE